MLKHDNYYTIYEDLKKDNVLMLEIAYWFGTPAFSRLALPNLFGDTELMPTKVGMSNRMNSVFQDKKQLTEYPI